MHSRNEYLKVVKERYFKARTKKEKSQILNEYCSNTGQTRKYVIRKIHRADPGLKQRKKRKEIYDGQVKAALAKIWEIFDCPCGQRLKPLLEMEVDRLRELGEIEISDEVAWKLEIMSSATIDRKLKHQREFLHLSRSKGGPKPGYLLKQKIPVRLTQWDTSRPSTDKGWSGGGTPQGGPPLNPPYLARDVSKWILSFIVALLPFICPM